MKNIIVALLTAIVFAGCASTGTVVTTQAPTIRIGDYKTIDILTSSSIPETGEEIVLLESEIQAKLHEAGLFEAVFIHADSSELKSDLMLKANITTLNRVDRGTRLILGALAGQASISIDVKLSEKSSGKDIGTFTTEGKSSGGSIFAGTTPQAIDRAVEQIVEFVKNSM